MRRSNESLSGPDSAVSEALSEALKGWKVRKSPRPEEFDLQMSGPGGVVAVEVKAVRDVRPDSVEGALARAILQLSRIGAEGPIPMVALIVPRLGPSTVERVRSFMAQFGSGMGWAVVASDGSHAVEISRLGLASHSVRPRASTHSRPVSGASTLFTDLNCWLLKLLLLSDVRPELWSGPRAPIRTPIELMQVGSVSRITAYRFVRIFTEADYLRATPAGFQIVRRDALLRAWRSVADAAVVRATPVRWLLGRPSRLEDVFTMDKMRYAVTGFEACRRLGVLHASSKRTEVYVPGVDLALRRLDLALAAPAEADFYLLQATQSVSRGATLVDGTMVVDILQAALDVAGNAARGREQSDYIFHHVLGWKNV